MKLSKIVSVVIIVVLFSVLLSACGQVDFTYKQNRNGTYTKEITVTIDDEASVSLYGYTIESTIEALKNGFVKYGYSVATGEKSITARKTYDTLEELRNSEFSNGIVVEKGNYADNENAFIRQRTVYGDFVLSDEYINNSQNKILIASILAEGGITYAKAREISEALVNAKRTYTYITPYKSTSSNADSVTKDEDGYYVHRWNDASNSEPVITTSAIKGAMWYGVAIIISVTVLLIVVIVKLIKEKRKE